MGAVFTALILGIGAAIYGSALREEKDPFVRAVGVAWVVIFVATALLALAKAA